MSKIDELKCDNRLCNGTKHHLKCSVAIAYDHLVPPQIKRLKSFQRAFIFNTKNKWFHPFHSKTIAYSNMNQSILDKCEKPDYVFHDFVKNRILVIINGETKLYLIGNSHWKYYSNISYLVYRDNLVEKIETSKFNYWTLYGLSSIEHEFTELLELRDNMEKIINNQSELVIEKIKTLNRISSGKEAYKLNHVVDSLISKDNSQGK